MKALSVRARYRITAMAMFIALLVACSVANSPSAWADEGHLTGQGSSASLADKGEISSLPNMKYTGSPLQPVPTVSYDSSPLQEGRDYTLSWSDNTDVGMARVTATGTGSYSGTISTTFTIDPVQISETNPSLMYTSVYWSGLSNQSPLNTPTYRGQKLRTSYYATTYENDWKVGTAKATVLGRGNFTGSCTLYYSILRAPITNVSLALERSSYTYSGLACEPLLQTAKYYEETLSNGTDYTITWKDNVNAGTGTATVTGLGNYSGSQDLTFTINPVSIDTAVLALNKTSFEYTGKACKPTLKTATLNGRELTSGTDYTISWKNNTKVGTATAIVTGMGNLTGTKNLTFKITEASSSSSSTSSKNSITKAKLALKKSSYTYTGKACKPKLKTAKFNGVSLKRGTDYKLKWKNNKTAGTAQAVVTGIGAYTGKKTLEFTIKQAPIAKATVKLKKAALSYTGKACKPKLKTVAYNGEKLRKKSDFHVAYSNNRTVGAGYLILKGAGNFKGSKKIGFRINPPTIQTRNVKKVTIKGGGRGLKLTCLWKVRGVAPSSAIADSYEVQVSSSRNFAHDVRSIRIQGQNQVAKLFNKNHVTLGLKNNLSTNDVYYMRIIARKTINGTTYQTASKVATCR